MNQEERRELVKYRITKASDTFNEVDLHIKNLDFTICIQEVLSTTWLPGPGDHEKN